MAQSPQFDAFLVDLFANVPGVDFRRMFGGIGIFRQGLMFALSTGEDRIALKADKITIPDFEAENVEQWNTPTQRKSKPTAGYWDLPERMLEDPEEFEKWAIKAFDAAIRADAAKPPKQRKFKPI